MLVLRNPDESHGGPDQKFLVSTKNPDSWLLNESRYWIYKTEILERHNSSIFYYEAFLRRFPDAHGLVEHCETVLETLRGFQKESFNELDRLEELINENSIHIYRAYYFYNEKDFEDGFIFLNDKGEVIYEDWLNSDGPEE